MKHSSPQISNEERLSNLYSGLKDKHVHLQGLYRQQKEEIALLKKEIADIEGKAIDIPEYTRQLEALCQSHGLIKAVNRISKGNYVTEKSYKKLLARCNNFINLFWDAKKELNALKEQLATKQ